MSRGFSVVVQEDETHIRMPLSFYNEHKEELMNGATLIDPANNHFEVHVISLNFDHTTMVFSGSIPRLRSTYNVYTDLLVTCVYGGSGRIYLTATEKSRNHSGFIRDVMLYIERFQTVDPLWLPYNEVGFEWVAKVVQGQGGRRLPLVVPHCMLRRLNPPHCSYFYVILPSGLVDRWRLNGSLLYGTRVLVVSDWIEFGMAHGIRGDDQVTFKACRQRNLFRLSINYID